LSETRVESSISNAGTIYALLVLEKGEEETPLHSLAHHPFQEFEDVFPNDLASGLPPLKGIKHHIDLLP